ncbi:LXG domain-containing protein [Cytobacillus firmus]|uniref:LXG domain-containing protein n=1 Tax=Cytobacillus firmus TaxID=1399 RepID=UPI00320A97BF
MPAPTILTLECRGSGTFFLQFFESWIDEYHSYLKSFIGSLKAFEPSPSGFIRQEFLEHELKQGLKNTLQITAELTEEANNIMKSVSDIVALPRLEDGRFIQATKSAEASSRETVEKLEDFDHREKAELDPLLQDLSLMNQYIQKMAGLFQSGSLSLEQYQPKSLNWKDFHEEISNPNSESELSNKHRDGSFVSLIHDASGYALFIKKEH